MNETVIENFWKRSRSAFTDGKIELTSNWNEEVKELYKFGIGLETVSNYLHFQQPDLIEFKNWVAKNAIAVNIDESKIDDVLTAADLDFFEKNGYIVLKNAISKTDCIATQNAIWSFMGMDAADKNSWYRPHQQQSGLMVNFSNHETLNKNREAIRIKKAYEQLYKTTHIYKAIDKISFNPPITPTYHFMGSDLHWDVSLRPPIPFRLQGLLYLSDCNENDGAFHCVPGFHNSIDKWLTDLDADTNPREFARQNFESLPIIGQAGDCIIWHQALPHCATANKGNTPRMVQYLTYIPENYQEDTDWI